jgi:hypothetical protein
LIALDGSGGLAARSSGACGLGVSGAFGWPPTTRSNRNSSSPKLVAIAIGDLNDATDVFALTVTVQSKISVQG